MLFPKGPGSKAGARYSHRRRVPDAFEEVKNDLVGFELSLPHAATTRDDKDFWRAWLNDLEAATMSSSTSEAEAVQTLAGFLDVLLRSLLPRTFYCVPDAPPFKPPATARATSTISTSRRRAPPHRRSSVHSRGPGRQR